VQECNKSNCYCVLGSCAAAVIGSTKMELAYLLPKRRVPPWGLVALGWRVYNIEKDMCFRDDW